MTLPLKSCSDNEFMLHLKLCLICQDNLEICLNNPCSIFENKNHIAYNPKTKAHIFDQTNEEEKSGLTQFLCRKRKVSEDYLSTFENESYLQENINYYISEESRISNSLSETPKVNSFNQYPLKKSTRFVDLSLENSNNMLDHIKEKNNRPTKDAIISLSNNFNLDLYENISSEKYESPTSSYQLYDLVQDRRTETEVLLNESTITDDTMIVDLNNEEIELGIEQEFNFCDQNINLTNKEDVRKKINSEIFENNNQNLNYMNIQKVSFLNKNSNINVNNNQFYQNETLNEIIKNISALTKQPVKEIYLLIDKFSKIYKRIEKQVILSSFKSEKKSVQKITEEMFRKDELDKKINTLMKEIIQIILNILFTYDNPESIQENMDRNLIKKITIQKMTGPKVTVETIKNFHVKSIKEICKQNSLITSKKLRNKISHEDILNEELNIKQLFNFLFDMEFEVLLNLTYLEFSRNDFKEIQEFLDEYENDDKNKKRYKEEIILALQKRLNYLTSQDIVGNKKRKKKNSMKNNNLIIKISDFNEKGNIIHTIKN